jgi:hypothetical protein
MIQILGLFWSQYLKSRSTSLRRFFYENVSNEASVAHATIQEATIDPIISDLALLACE